MFNFKIKHLGLKLNMSETELIISPRPAWFSPCFSRAVNSTLPLGCNPWGSQMGTGQPVTPTLQIAAPHIPVELNTVLTSMAQTLRKRLWKNIVISTDFASVFFFFLVLLLSSPNCWQIFKIPTAFHSLIHLEILGPSELSSLSCTSFWFMTKL